MPWIVPILLSTALVSNYVFYLHSLLFYTKLGLTVILLSLSANTTRPKRTKALEERRLQILSLDYGKRSLKYLLEESKLRDCGLVGKNEYTDDTPNKYSDWRDVPVPRSYKSPSSMPPLLGSPAKTPQRTQSEHEGIIDRMYKMYSPTLLSSCRNQLVSCPWLPDHNLFIWANPDLIVHRYDRGLKSWQVMYSSYEIMDGYLDQYGTNEYKDFSNLTISVDDFHSTITEPESVLGPCLPSEPALVSPS